MSTATVATPTVIQAKALADDRLPSSVTRRPTSAHECITRRKSADALRNRHSWRYSWRNILSKPFNGQSSGFRGKNKIRKKFSGSLRDVSEESVENRKKMDKLLRLWHTETIDSSDDSSDDDDRILADRRRSCSPRVIGNDTTSSEDEEEVILEAPVSLYVSEGPSRTAILGPRAECTTDRANAGPGSRLSAVPRRDSLTVEIESKGESMEVNSNLEVLTGVQTPINHSCNNNVIAALQIYDLERSGASAEQVTHTCSFNRNLNEGAFGDGSKVRYGSCVGGQGGGNFKGYVKDDLEIGRYRVDWTSQQAADLEGPIKVMLKDRLSVSLEDNHLELENDELMNKQRNEDGTAGVESRTGHEDNDFTSSDMDDSFTAQDLNAIRRFLGMSLQQIDANKMFDNESGGGSSDVGTENSHTSTMVVSLANLKESGSEQVVSSNSKDVLPDYPSSYPKQCEETKEQIFSNHDDDSFVLQCEFKEFGCQFTGTKCSLHLENHMASNLTEHLNLVSKTATDQKRQLQEQKSLQETQGLLIRELTDTVRNLKHLVEDQTKNNATQEKIVHSLKDQLKEQRKQSQRFEHDISHQFQTLSQPASPTTTPLPTILGAAEMLWPIKNFTKILRQARENEIDDPLISEPFYSGQYGYKLSLWVYINGRGKNLGTCVSVYARIMPGEHDAILSWPVRPAYTFTLFDQSGGDKNIVRTRKINGIKRDGGKHQGIERPGGGDRSVIVGFDDFVAHDQLEKRNYLKDDCFYLKLDAELLG